MSDTNQGIRSAYDTREDKYITKLQSRLATLEAIVKAGDEMASEINVFLNEVEIEALKLNRYTSYPALRLKFAAYRQAKERKV